MRSGSGERPLEGGVLGGAVRVDDTVHRSTGVWTTAVHALLRHLEARGLAAVPRVRGFDDEGREVLDYLPGETVGSALPWPDWTRSVDVLTAAARMLAAYHRAVADFEQPVGTRWRLTEARPAAGEIICHNDFAPYNVAWRAPAQLGLFDWDVAGPGRPEFDVAFGAWNFVPLHTEARCRELGWSGPVDRSGRLRAFVDSYGLDDRGDFVEVIATRMQASIDRIAHGAAVGDAGFARLVESGYLDPLRAARDQLLRDATLLQRAID